MRRHGSSSILGACLQASGRQFPPRIKHIVPLRRAATSLQAQEQELAQLPGIDPGLLSVTQTTTPKKVVPPEELVFGRTFTGKVISMLRSIQSQLT